MEPAVEPPEDISDIPADVPTSSGQTFPALEPLENIRMSIMFRALTGVGAGLLEWGVMSPSEAVYVCLLVFNQSGVDLESFSGASRSRKCLG